MLASVGPEGAGGAEDQKAAKQQCKTDEATSAEGKEGGQKDMEVEPPTQNALVEKPKAVQVEPGSGSSLAAVAPMSKRPPAVASASGPGKSQRRG